MDSFGQQLLGPADPLRRVSIYSVKANTSLVTALEACTADAETQRESRTEASSSSAVVLTVTAPKTATLRVGDTEFVLNLTDVNPTVSTSSRRQEEVFLCFHQIETLFPSTYSCFCLFLFASISCCLLFSPFCLS